MSITIVSYQPEFESGLCALDNLCEPVRKRLAWRQRHVPWDPSGAFVALEHGRVVGSAMLRTGLHRINNNLEFLGYCADVAVHPDHRRKGLALTLSQKVMDHARKKNCAGVFLYTDKITNPGAFALYQKLGFQEVGAVSMLVLGPPSDPGVSGCIVRGAQEWDKAVVLSLQESQYQHHAFYCPESPWRFSIYRKALFPGNSTFVVEKNGKTVGSFGVFHYGGLWDYQTPMGLVIPLLLHHPVHDARCTEQEYWSAVTKTLRAWQAGHPMIGLFVDAIEQARLEILGAQGFASLQSGQWYYKPLSSSSLPRPPLYTGFPL